MLLAEVAAASVDVGATSSRLAKIARLADVLAAAEPDEIAIIVSWLSGELPQRQIGVGWASLRSGFDPAAESTLDVRGVDAAFTEIGQTSGTGSQSRRAELLRGLFECGHRGRAGVPARAARRRAAPGRADRRDGRRGREGRRPARPRRPAGRHARRRTARGRRSGADRRRRGPGRVRVAGRPAGRADARADGGRRRRRVGAAGRAGRLRGQARRRPGADPPHRRRGLDLHPQRSTT